MLYGRVPSAIPRPISRGTVERRKRNRIKPVKPIIQRKMERIPTADEWGAFDTTRRIKPVKPKIQRKMKRIPSEDKCGAFDTTRRIKPVKPIIQRKHTMRRPIRPSIQDNRKTPVRKKTTMSRRTINIGAFLPDGR